MLELNKEKFKVVGYNDADAEAIVRPNITYWQDAWRRLKQNKVAILSIIVLAVLTIMVIIGPYISGISYKFQNLSMVNKAPNAKYWFGTDQLGRDMFSRVWMGGRISIFIGIAGTIIEVVIGSIYGGISGYTGGLTDDIMMRIVEVINGIPSMIVIILASLVLPPGIPTLIVALCLTGWTGVARLIRGQVLQLKESEYVLAAQALGAEPGRIIAKHLIPNTIGVLIVFVSFDVPSFIFAEAFLSFLGLGVQPPQTSWGALAAAGQQLMDFYPYQLLFPSLAIALTMLSFSLLGDGLRDALDPKLRQ